MYFRILVYLVIYDSGLVSLEHLLLSWYTQQTKTGSAPISKEGGKAGKGKTNLEGNGEARKIHGRDVMAEVPQKLQPR